ncbi:MAG: hypothetical protein IPJ34_34360 [Myxococcales bacterium]|nr:hypothetical protein [Myxococcales bacterium]
MHRPLLAIAVLTLLACDQKKDPEKSSASTAASSAGSASVAPAVVKLSLDATLVDHVKAHAEGCTVSVEAGQAYSCKAGITDAMGKYVREKKPEDFASTMLSLIKKTEDAKVSAAAVALFAEQFDYLGEDGKRKNATPAVVKAGLEAFKDNAGNRATRLANPVTQLATLAGSFDELYAVADAHSVKEARDNVYRNLLVYGRLKALPKLKLVAQRPEHVVAALDAVPRMASPTPDEKAAVCPWAKGYLASTDAQAAAKAGWDMVVCKGEYIDALVAEAETRLKNKEFKEPFSSVMREPCFEFITDITKKAAADTQCEAVFTFLEKVVNDGAVDDATRGLALFNIYYQRRDDKTLKLMRKYENHANKEVSKRAKEAIKSLTTTYKLKG